jgi:hypothetical protein
MKLPNQLDRNAVALILRLIAARTKPVTTDPHADASLHMV